jgi:site-specific recombinase XerD
VRRHHLDENGLQKAVRQAARRAGITTVSDRVGPHTLRQCEASLWDCFATHLLENHYDTLRGTVQELLGHKACPERSEGTSGRR